VSPYTDKGTIISVLLNIKKKFIYYKNEEHFDSKYLREQFFLDNFR